MIRLPPHAPRAGQPRLLLTSIPPPGGTLEGAGIRHFEAQALLARLGQLSVETETHTRRVATLMSRVCARLQLAPDLREALHFGALLHDIGKLYVRPDVLHKPEALDEREWQEMKLHPTAGAIIADQRGFARETCLLILHHHERFDGSGYPGAMAGGEIPLGARIFSVVDTYDAVTSDRCYRRARPPNVAAEILRAESGSQFDPEVVETFLSACVD